MRGCTRFCVALAVVGLVATTGALAQHPQVVTDVDKDTAPVIRELRGHGPIQIGPDPMPMPTPVEPAAGTSAFTPRAPQRGILASSDGTLGARSIVAPRGAGAMSTPKQQADREIRRLIRRLD